MTFLSVASRVISRSTRGSSALSTQFVISSTATNFLYEHKSTQNVCSNTAPSSYPTVFKSPFHSSPSMYEDSGSHSDFAPKRKSVDGDDVQKLIHEHVTNNRIMLYMKGTPSMPQCGFSAQVVKILQMEGVDFSSVNVLDYPQIREGVKKYSDWPTIPQLYVGGEFIGGCDIVMSMHQNGELGDLVKKKEE